MNFGRVSSRPRRAKKPGEAFRIAVLGDFSGRANEGKLETGAALAGRKPLRVDVDNFEKVLRQMGLHLHLPIADDGGTVEIKIASIDDFHPDQLYNNLPFFSELSGLRRRLQNNSTFAAAAAEMQSWSGLAADGEATPARAKPRGTAMPQGRLSDFARLIGQTTATAPRETPVDQLIQQLVASHVVPSAHPDQQAAIAAVDEAISAAMRRIIHHPDFQTLESLWRSVELLTRELETGTQLEIMLYDVTAEEIAADLSASDALESSGMYRLFVEQPAMDEQIGPTSVLVGNYLFELTPPHAELLGRIGKVAAAAQSPFIAGISPESLVKRDPDEIPPALTESWTALRQAPQAKYLGLTVPRFMLRWPYGEKTEPIESFRFEEFTPAAGLKGMLWANGSILAGLLLGKTFSEQGLAGMKLGSVMTIGDVPFYYYTDADGDQIALPSTERLVSESTAAYAMSQNFMPVVCIRGRPEVRLGSFHSLAGSELAGPWAPVELEPDEGAAADAATPPAADEAALVEQIEARETAEAEQELDALLAGFAAESSREAIPSGEGDMAGGGDEDLDTLLAGITGTEDQPTPSAEAGEMDPDLAALLADL
jgi:type VI secretion system protein ImpC